MFGSDEPRKGSCRGHFKYVTTGGAGAPWAGQGMDPVSCLMAEMSREVQGGVHEPEGSG